MPAIPIAKGAYKRPDNPEIVLRNMRYEADPANTEDQVSIAARPGLDLWRTGNPGAPRGVFYIEAADRIVSIVSGTVLTGWLADTGSMISSPPTIPGTEPCTLASLGRIGGAGDLSLLCTGTALYSTSYSVGDTTLLAPGFSASSITAGAERYIATERDTQRYWWSDVNSTTFNPLSFASAVSEPDALVACKYMNDTLVLFGRKTIEFHQPTGDADLPFQRINGRTFGYGLANRATIAQLEDSLFFVARQEAIAMQMAPNPVRISDPAIEAMIATSNLDTINGFCAAVDGHAYYVLNLGDVSMAYDGSTKTWAEWKTHERDDFEGRYAAPFGDGRYVVGGLAGEINFLNPSRTNDNDKPIVRNWSGWAELSANLRCDNVLLECTVGSAATYPEDPKIGVRYSDDRGKTWSDWLWTPLGHKGDFSCPIFWTRLGLMRRPGRLFEWQCSEDLPLMVRKAKINERV